MPDYGDQWTNSLSGRIDVSVEDIQHANKVWNLLGGENSVDCHMLYLKTDVIILADVFGKYQELFDQVYGLDPYQYYSAPNMLKTTEVKLDLTSDIDKLLFCERAIREGLNGIGEERYMKANNKYLDGFDE